MTDTTQHKQEQEPILTEFFGSVVEWKAQPNATLPEGINLKTVDGKIALIKQFCDGIVITDAATLKVGKTALSKLVSYRTGIDKKRLEIKREVDSEAKRITALLAPIEESTRKKVDAEEQKAARIEAERRAWVDEQMRVAGYTKQHGVFTVGKMIVSEEMAYKASKEQLDSYIQNGLAAKATEEAEQAELKRLRELEAQQATPPQERERGVVFNSKQHGETVVNLPKPDPFENIPAPNAYDQNVTVDPNAAPASDSTNEHHPHEQAMVDTPETVRSNTTPIEEYRPGYIDGFNACKQRALEMMNSDLKLTRAQWIERITTMKP